MNDVNLTQKDLYCIAMTLQAQKYKLKLNGEISDRQACELCRYNKECYSIVGDQIKKHRHGFNEMLGRLQTVTGGYLGR